MLLSSVGLGGDPQPFSDPGHSRTFTVLLLTYCCEFRVTVLLEPSLRSQVFWIRIFLNSNTYSLQPWQVYQCHQSVLMQPPPWLAEKLSCSGDELCLVSSKYCMMLGFKTVWETFLVFIRHKVMKAQSSIHSSLIQLRWPLNSSVDHIRKGCIKHEGIYSFL